MIEPPIATDKYITYLVTCQNEKCCHTQPVDFWLRRRAGTLTVPRVTVVCERCQCVIEDAWKHREKY